MVGNWQALADYLDAERMMRGWTQHDLAEAAGVTERAVRDLLSGRPRERMPRKVAKIEHALHVSGADPGKWPPGTAYRIVYEDYHPPLYAELDAGPQRGEAEPDLRDDDERYLWARRNLTADQRWTLIYVLRTIRRRPGG